MIKFSDIVHFYQGCKFIIKEPDGSDFTDTLNIVSVWDDGHIEVWGNECECVPLEDIKLVLRSDDDMTEDEETEYYELCKKILHKKNPEDEKENMLSTVDSPESFAYMIMKRFDVYKLKDKGYAVYENMK